MWDEEYSVDEYVYGESPNDFLLEMTASLKKDNALPYYQCYYLFVDLLGFKKHGQLEGYTSISGTVA